MQKEMYAAERGLNTDDPKSEADFLLKELEYAKKMSLTKEDYIPKFEEYIDKLSALEYVEEKTTDDVVDELEEMNDKLDKLTDAIERASYVKG